jgi:hypothetical protein
MEAISPDWGAAVDECKIPPSNLGVEAAVYIGSEAFVSVFPPAGAYDSGLVGG